MLVTILYLLLGREDACGEKNVSKYGKMCAPNIFHNAILNMVSVCFGREVVIQHPQSFPAKKVFFFLKNKQQKEKDLFLHLLRFVVEFLSPFRFYGFGERQEFILLLFSKSECCCCTEKGGESEVRGLGHKKRKHSHPSLSLIIIGWNFTDAQSPLE